MDFVFKKGNRRSIKSEKYILPSQIQRIEKAKEVQKVLRTLCDTEDDDSSEKSFVSAKTNLQKRDTTNRRTDRNLYSSVQQKTTDLTDSGDNSFPMNENSSILYKKDKQSMVKGESERHPKVKSIRDSSGLFEKKVSRSVVKEKDILTKKYKISSDFNDSIDSLKMIKEKRNIKSKKMSKHEPNINRMYSSDSESDENDSKRVSSIFKRTLKDTRQQNEKMDNFCNVKSKVKTKKCYDSTSESEEDKESKKRNKKKRSEMNRTMLHDNNDKRKRDKSTKSRFSDIQKNDSDNSLSKEFQAIKWQKVTHNKYPTTQLVDLEIDHTKHIYSGVKNFTNNKSEKHIDKQSKNQNLENIKRILRDCKKICSNFQMYIETIEQLYSRDEKQFILKSIEKIDKLQIMLEGKRNNLTTCYQLWFKNRKKSTKKSSTRKIGEEKDVSNQDDQQKIISVTSEKVHNDSKTFGTNTDESLDDAKVLAKKVLQKTDSDMSDTLDDITKLTEDINNINRTGKENEVEDNDSDSDSISTIIFSSFINEANSNAKKDTLEINVEKKSDDRLNEKSEEKISSTDEDVKVEKTAKSVLESNDLDDFLVLSSESEKFTDKKSESDSSALTEMINVSKKVKHRHESDESGRESIVIKLKKRRFKLDNNYYYKNDKKLRMSCKVQLTRLSIQVLERYSRALRKSRKYLEHKAVKSSDSDDEEKSFFRKKKKKSGQRILHSDLDVKIINLDSDDSSKVSSAKQKSSDSKNDSGKEKEKLKRKKRKRSNSNSSDTDSLVAEKPKLKRKRIKCIKKIISDSENSSGNEEFARIHSWKKSKKYTKSSKGQASSGRYETSC